MPLSVLKDDLGKVVFGCVGGREVRQRSAENIVFAQVNFSVGQPSSNNRFANSRVLYCGLNGAVILSTASKRSPRSSFNKQLFIRYSLILLHTYIDLFILST